MALNLSSTQLQDFQKSLLSAFPSLQALAQMVRFELDQNLDQIAGGADLGAVAFALIQWVEARGKLDELLAGALAQNPDNPELQSFARQVEADTENSFSLEDVRTTIDVVVSYAAEDSAWVNGYLLETLHGAGLQVRSFELSTHDQIISSAQKQMVESSKRTVLVGSPDYLRCNLALLITLFEELYGAQRADWPVTLLVLKSIDPPQELHALPILDATDSAQWNSAVEKICFDLEHSPTAREEKILCPYPGMRPFGEVNSHHFFGRSNEVELLRQHLRLNPFIAVIGPSGSGKSSLVLAGLLPALREKSTFFGPGNWIIREMRPGTYPLSALNEAIDDLIDGTTWRRLDNSAISAVDRILLFVDQFEETFTFATEEEVRPFQEALLTLIEQENIYVILTVRADFYVDLMNSPLWPQISKRRLEVIPLKKEGLREAIVAPAANSGVYIENALVEQLLDDASDEPGVLPFVQETMVLLWEKLEERFLPLAAYQSLSDGSSSGLSGLYVAMTQRANSTLASFSPEQEKIARRILLRLIQFGEGRADTRRQQPVGSLLAHEADSTLFEETLRTLTTDRLLTLSAEEAQPAETGEPKVDIAHESLLNGWPQLRNWINERRTAELTRRRLEEKADDWVRLERGTGGLLADVALTEAEEWIESPDAQELGVSQELTELVVKSRQTLDEVAENERRGRLVRLALASAIGLLVITALAGGVWFQSRIAAQERANLEKTEVLLKESERQSNINRAQSIRVQSQLMLDRNAECSLALSLEAYDQATAISNFAPYPFQDSVRTALQATRTEQVLSTESGKDAVAWSHDGRTLATGTQRDGGSGTQIWEATDAGFVETTTRPNPAWVGFLAFSPDDNLLAIGSTEIVLWDQTTGEVSGTLTGHSDGVRMLAWHPNGRWLASGLNDGTVIIWDTQTETAVQTLDEHRRSDGVDGVYGLAWGPSGDWLATAALGFNVRIWDASGLIEDDADDNALTLQSSWYVNEQGPPLRLAWSPDGKRLAVSHNGGTIQVWDMGDPENLSNEQPTKQIIEAHTGAVWGLAWSPDGSRLVSSAEDQIIKIWSGQPIKLEAELSGHADSVAGGVAWNRDGTALVSASADQSVRVWRLEPSGRLSQKIDEFLLDAVWHPDSEQSIIAFVINPDIVRIWDITADTKRSIITDHNVTILRVAWSPDGEQIATASADTEIHVYDVQSGERLQRLTDHTGPVFDVAWSPDGQQLVSAGQVGDSTVRLWNLDDESSKRLDVSDNYYSISWHPDGTHVAAAGNKGISAWDIATDQHNVWSKHEAVVASVVWHPNGERLASGGQDGQILIWDTSGDDWMEGQLWAGREEGFDLGERLWDLDWYGDLLVASGANGSVRVWDVVTGETVANYGGHEGAVRAADWSQDGRYLSTVGMTDGKALVHYANFEEDLLPIARQQLENGSRPIDRERCLAGVN